MPDRREIEHRQIAASQYVEFLDELLPSASGGAEQHQPPLKSVAATSTANPKGAGASAAGGSVGFAPQTTAEVDRFLDDYFKQLYMSRNPMSGLMNIRLLNVVPENSLDLSKLIMKRSTTMSEKTPDLDTPVTQNSYEQLAPPPVSTVYPSGFFQLTRRNTSGGFRHGSWRQKGPNA